MVIINHERVGNTLEHLQDGAALSTEDLFE